MVGHISRMSLGIEQSEQPKTGLSGTRVQFGYDIPSQIVHSLEVGHFETENSKRSFKVK